MGGYIIRRLLQTIPLLILLSIFMFLLIHALPGGPEGVIYNPHLSAEGRAALRASFGLDQPLPIQYIKWLGNTLIGNFGYSFATNQPVSQLIEERFPATLELFSVALAIALVFAILLGAISAIKQNTILDYLLTSISYFGLAMPVFLLGLFAQEAFGIWLNLLPTSGTATLGETFDTFGTFLDHLRHLILPASVLAVLFTAAWSRYVRSSMIEVLNQDYVRTARAKGASPIRVLIRHALTNALIPLITVVAIDFGGVAGGAVITEGIFAWPGMGGLFLDSLNRRDYPVLMAILVLSSIFVIFFNLVADILYAIIDPRIRYN